MSELPQIVQALLDPKSYPDPTKKVEIMQTQMSFVFLAGDYVYKMKKPVDLGYLDYTTLDKRQFFCHKEVELNQRLCPEAYLGVVSITDDNGHISIEGSGKVIEYAVKMRYLPQELMMDALLAKNKVSAEMITRVAQTVAEFHQKAETNTTISTFGDIDTLTLNSQENFTQTVKYIGSTISEAQFRHIKNWTEDFIEKNTPLFRKRIADGKIRDCHGDLHAAHICFSNGICIYDCIEFNDRFRYCDIAAEVSFLTMDLDRYERADLSRNFVDAYVDFSHDKELLQLFNYYRCYFAYVRGKVECFKLDDPYISGEEKMKILSIARRYFELAESYAVPTKV